jgi:hypothetical protein
MVPALIFEKARVSARGLRRPPPLCTSRLSSVLNLERGLRLKEASLKRDSALFFHPANVWSKVGLSIEIHKIHDVSIA